MTEQPLNPGSNEDHEGRLGQLLEFPGARVPTQQQASEQSDETDEPQDTDEHPGSAVATDDTDRAPVPTGEAPHRAPHVPPALRAAGTRTWDLSKRAAHAARPVVTTTAQVTVRHGSYTLGGAYAVSRQAARQFTHGDINDAIRSARAAGDHGTVSELIQRKKDASNSRVERAVTMTKLAGRLAATALGTWMSTTGIVALSGLIAQIMPGGHDWNSVWTEGYWTFWVGCAEWIVWLASYWPAALTVGLIAAAGSAWTTGRNLNSAPGFAQSGARASNQVVPVDETSIGRALGALGIKAINDHIKQDLPFDYTVMPHRTKTEDGDKDVGVTAQVRLPGGTPAEEVVKKSKFIASSLARAKVEVWPSVGEDESLLNLWVADRGSLDGGSGPWPWLERTDAIDLYQGVPIGRSLDGRMITAPIDGASYLVGGQPGQGKSQFVRTLVTGAMFDPRARIRVHVLASNNDYAPMRPRLEKYRAGLGIETIHSALAEMEELYDELESRGAYMEEHGYDTASEAGFEPIVSVFDEIHQGFQCREKETREAIAAYAEDLAKLARKYGILVIYATQSADATSIPKGVTRQCQQRIAYSVVDQPANDGLLGSGSYKNGVTATTLRPGNKNYHGDRGKSVTRGLVPDADWAMCVGYYIDSSVLPGLTDTALQIQSAHGTETVQVQQADEDRDLLDDLGQVLGTEPMSTADVVSLLRDLAPKWRPYKNLTGKQLQKILADEYGYRVPTTGNRPRVQPERIAELRARQATSDLDAQDDE